MSHARCRGLATDVGPDEGLEGRTTEQPSEPLIIVDSNSTANAEELKTIYPKLDLWTVKA